MNRKNLRLEGNGNNDKSYERNGYPIESISESLKNLTKIQKETNYQQRINKESIGKVLNKKVDSLNLQCSTWRQYGLITSVFGNGYDYTDLFLNYLDKFDKAQNYDAELKKMFSSPQLYKLLIKDYDGRVLPDESTLEKIVENSPYKINNSRSSKVVKVFYENIRYLKFLSDRNVFDTTGESEKTLLPLQIPSTINTDKHFIDDNSYYEVPLLIEEGLSLKSLFIPKESPIKYMKKMIEILQAMLLNGENETNNLTTT